MGGWLAGSPSSFVVDEHQRIQAIEAQMQAIEARMQALEARMQALEINSLPVVHSLPLSNRSRVVLFMHLPKCAGTTVRSLFFKERGGGNMTKVWIQRTLWSAGPRSILSGILSALRDRLPFVFAEMHLKLDWTLAKKVRDASYRLRARVDGAPLNATVYSFTIWREPASLALSNWAFWWSNGTRGDVARQRAAAWLRASPEFLFFGNAGTMSRGSIPVQLEPAEANDTQGCQERAADRDACVHTARVRRQLSRHGCAPLVRAGLDALAGLSEVFLFEDRRSLSRVRDIAAAGRPFGASTNAAALELARGRMRTMVGSYNRSDETLQQVARENNECSLQLDALVRSRHAGRAAGRRL